MRKVFQFMIAGLMCLLLTSHFYGNNKSEHDKVSDEPHIILTPNQSGDALTVKLSLSEEMFDRQIASMHLSIDTSESIQDYQNAFIMDKELKQATSISDYSISEDKIDLLFSNKTSLFQEKEIVLGTIRIDSEEDFEIEFTPGKIAYVYVAADSETTEDLECPSVILSNRPIEQPVNPDNKPENPTDKLEQLANKITVEQLGQNDLTIAKESQKVVQTSSAKYLSEHYADVLANLPEDATLKAQLTLRNLTQNDLTLAQQEMIKDALKADITILAHYDISVTVTAYAKDGQIIPEINGVEISEMDSPIKLSMTLSGELMKENRQFGMVRLHNDEVIGLASSMANENIITFETDHFSIYTLIAKDYTQEEVNNNPDILDKPIVSPGVQTGDHTSLVVPMTLVAFLLAGIILCLSLKRKKLLIK